MRHAKAGKKLGRDSAHRKALYSNLAGALITHGRIETTEAKAKAVKPFAEKMITLGKRGDLHARRLAMAELRSNDVVHKLFSDVAPRFAERNGGYTRVVKLGPRQGDAASMSSSTSSRPPDGGRLKSILARQAGFGRSRILRFDPRLDRGRSPEAPASRSQCLVAAGGAVATCNEPASPRLAAC
jgi:large subunit ribosomal protein L17